jgi:5'-methylthioinosine phosphorylase
MLAFIGGTGLTRLPNLEIIERKQIRTRYGEVRVVRGELAGKPVLFLARHGDPHVLLPHQVNYRANIMALKEAGATHIIAVNAVGGIGAEAQAGVLVLPHQIIDYTHGRDSSFFDDPASPLVHVDFTEPFDAALRGRLRQALGQSQLDWVDGGCYGVTQGPRLETAAEIARMERDGCTLVGMTAMPEAVLARELELPHAMLSLVVNPAAGKAEGEITIEQIEQVIHDGMSQVCDFLAGFASGFDA